MEGLQGLMEPTSQPQIEEGKGTNQGDFRMNLEEGDSFSKEGSGQKGSIGNLIALPQEVLKSQKEKKKRRKGKERRGSRGDLGGGCSRALLLDHKRLFRRTSR